MRHRLLVLRRRARRPRPSRSSGLTYAKRFHCILLATLVCCDSVCRIFAGVSGRLRTVDADRVPHRERDRRRGRHRRRLADADDAALRLVLQADVDLRDVRHAGEQVPLHVRVDHLAGVAIEDAILEQREVQRADDAAVDLALGGEPARRRGRSPGSRARA